MVAEVPVKGVCEENCYFFIDDPTKHGFVIDPGAQGEGLLRLIRKEGWTIEKILLTHGHFDHTGAVDLLRKELGIPVLAHSRSREYLLDPRMNLSVFCGPPLVIKETASFDEGDVIMLSAAPAISLRVLYTPGHTTDSVVLYSAVERAAFVGDTIFKGSLGDTRYPGGKRSDLLRSIGEKIFSLPEDTVLYSGHSEKTTVGVEKRRYGM